jgi:hypothetical protein
VRKHARERPTRRRWDAFRGSPFPAALVLTLILAAAAGLFAGSYTYAMANPAPRHLPVAVIGPPARTAALVTALDRSMSTTLAVRTYPSYASARRAVEEQSRFAILEAGRSAARLDIAPAAGASVARLLVQAAPKASATARIPLAVRDVKPLQPSDPQGLALFYISLAAVIIGFVGAIQLSVHARPLNPAERIGFIAASSLLGGFAIGAVVDWLLGVLALPFLLSWTILSFTLFTSGMVFTMFNTLVGRWAMLPTWGLMVLLGNPSSGGAVSWPLLPSGLGAIGRWLPPGASVSAQHTAVYFSGHQHIQPYLVLGAWSVVSLVVFVVWRHRHPGGRPRPEVRRG